MEDLTQCMDWWQIFLCMEPVIGQCSLLIRHCCRLIGYSLGAEGKAANHCPYMTVRRGRGHELRLSWKSPPCFPYRSIISPHFIEESPHYFPSSQSVGGERCMWAIDREQCLILVMCVEGLEYFSSSMWNKKKQTIAVKAQRV